MDFMKLRYNLSSNASDNLARLKVKLGITDDSKDAVLAIMLDDSINMILLCIEEDTLPQKFKFIAEEITIKRYRKIGSEGLTSESIDVIKSDFESNLLDEYKDIFEDYKSKKNNKLRLF